MLENIKMDANQISFYLWVSILAGVFSIYSIKDNIEFINIGFVTFAYGIIAHIIFKSFDNIGLLGKTQIFFRILLEFITISFWLYFAINLI